VKGTGQGHYLNRSPGAGGCETYASALQSRELALDERTSGIARRQARAKAKVLSEFTDGQLKILPIEGSAHRANPLATGTQDETAGDGTARLQQESGKCPLLSTVVPSQS